MPPLEGDEEVKEGKGLKILTPKNVLTRLPIIINTNKVKARNNSYKFIQILYLLYQHNKITKKSLQQFNQVITIIEETFCFNFDWPKNVDENLKHEIEFIIKSNESLAENKIKNEIEKLLLKHKHGSNIHEHRKSKTNELHKFVLNLDLESTGGNIALQNLTFYYTWKNIRKQYKNNKLKTIAPTWNNEFDLPDGFYSVSDIQDNIEYTIKKGETLTTIPPVYVYINRINKRIVFKIKDGCKVEMQMLETMKIMEKTYQALK